jgi:hypothetical protein
MKISRSVWTRYIRSLRAINDAAANDIEKWLRTYASEDGVIRYDWILSSTDYLNESFIDYCYEITKKYGDAEAAISAQMYDALAELEGALVPPAELAPSATYHEVAKTVNGVLKTSYNTDEMIGAVTRLVKKAGCDTTLKNAYRDRAEFAWIPSGDSCAFCMALASNGWVNVSARKIKKGYPHAEHIHSNCDCTYAIRFNRDTDIAGYDPDRYNKVFEVAEDRATDEGYDVTYGVHRNFDRDNINAVRRMQYAQSHQ